MMKKKIAIVDDEQEILDLLSKKLSDYNYDTDTYTNGNDLIDSIKAGCIYSLILLDINLPGGEDGINICREIKCMVDIPVIFLSGYNEVVDKIVGLEVGADDYVTKPFDFRELLSRIKTVLRRTKSSFDSFTGIYESSTWKLDFSKRVVIYNDKSFVKLTTGLFDLLIFLISNKETIINREVLYQELFQESFENYDRRLDVRISQLRKIIDQKVEKGTYIVTIKGIGYQFVENP